MRLQQREAALHIRPPLGRPPMHQLRQPRLGRPAELPQALALIVEASPDAVASGSLGRPASEFGRLCCGDRPTAGATAAGGSFMLASMKRLAVSTRRAIPAGLMR